jgi:hypothetical protein
MNFIFSSVRTNRFGGGSAEAKNEIFGMKCRKIVDETPFFVACEGKFRDSPERSEGEDPFSVACEGKFRDSPERSEGEDPFSVACEGKLKNDK